MMKVYALLIQFFLANVLTHFSTLHAHGYALDGEQGYYEINTDQLPLLQERLMGVETPASQEFLETIDKARRPETPQIPAQGLRNFFYQIRAQMFIDLEKIDGRTSGFKSQTPIPHDATKEIPEMMSLISNYFDQPLHLQEATAVTNHKIAKIYAQYKEKFLSDISSMHEDYEHQLGILGPWRLSTFREFINLRMLGMVPYIQSNIDGNQALFNLMKETGFLKTEIDGLSGYRYSQYIAARDYLQNHPEVTKIVLNCGSFIANRVSRFFFERSEAVCHQCDSAHHPSKKEMTVSLDIDQDGRTSDILGDINSLDFWNGVEEGLNGRKITLIDHSECHAHGSCSKIQEIQRRIRK